MMNEQTSTADVAPKATASDVNVTSAANSTKLAAQLSNANANDNGDPQVDRKTTNADADSPSSVVGSPVVVNPTPVTTINNAVAVAFCAVVIVVAFAFASSFAFVYIFVDVFVFVVVGRPSSFVRSRIRSLVVVVRSFVRFVVGSKNVDQKNVKIKSKNAAPPPHSQTHKNNALLLMDTDSTLSPTLRCHPFTELHRNTLQYRLRSKHTQRRDSAEVSLPDTSSPEAQTTRRP